MNKNSIAFGAPGIEPRWTSSAKDGIGTAYHSSSTIWFTLSHGIVNEIYFPHVDPHSPVLLIQTRLEILDAKLRGKLRLFALLAPHMKGTGKNNSAWKCGLGGRQSIEVQREDVDMSFGCAPDFTRRSIGYVGFSDGW